MNEKNATDPQEKKNMKNATTPTTNEQKENGTMNKRPRKTTKPSKPQPQTLKEAEQEVLSKLVGSFTHYDGATIRWHQYTDHYELIFTDDFIAPTSRGGMMMDRSGYNVPPQLPGRLNPIGGLLTDIVIDMKASDHSKPVHVYVSSYGGEVTALSMILQQLLSFPTRIGINLGTACSCGWMLLFACQERYVSPFSQAMYHDISLLTGGKHTELRHNAEFMGKLQKELLKVTDTVNVLTERELELGRTTEVWFTGRELIERGAAKDYTEFLAQQRLVQDEKNVPHT